MHHLLFCCPLRPCPPSLLHLSLAPPCLSSSLLCPAAWGSSFTVLWRELCLRAVELLSSKEPPVASGNGMGEQNLSSIDTRGHVLEKTTQDHAYVYCGRCFISRRIRDVKFLISSPCQGGEQVKEGETKRVEGHQAQLILATWKLSCIRPRFRCQDCSLEWWATGKPLGKCVRAIAGATSC